MSEQTPKPASWISGDHRIDYHPWFHNQAPHFYVLSHKDTGQMLSNLTIGREGHVSGVETHPKHQREGLATKLWNIAKHHSETTPGVPTPKHSTSRTRKGDAWAKKVGGDVPPVKRESLLSARQMQGMLRFD